MPSTKTYESKNTTTRVHQAGVSNASVKRVERRLSQVSRDWVRLHRQACRYFAGAYCKLYNVLRETQGFQEVRAYLQSVNEPEADHAFSVQQSQDAGHTNLPITKISEHQTEKGGDNE